MNAESLAFLNSLLETPSPSGFETRAQQIWIDAVKPFADTVETDAYGNAYATLNPSGSPRVVLAGHIDELGFMINHITDEGFLHFVGIGGIDRTLVRGQRVIVHGAKGPVVGVTGLLAIHMQKPDDREKVPELHEMYIDIGVTSRVEAEQLVSVGDAVTYQAGFQKLHGTRVAARGCDNRIGVWAAAEALKQCAEQRDKLSACVIAVSTIQEENGLYGARMAGHHARPDVAVVVDVTHATDIPSCSKAKHGSVKLGAGPVLSIGSANHPALNRRLEEVAKAHSLPIQKEVNPRWTGTDADEIFRHAGGVPTVSLGLPNRYMHSPVEVIDLQDLDRLAQWMACFALDLKTGERFKAIP